MGLSLCLGFFVVVVVIFSIVCCGCYGFFVCFYVALVEGFCVKMYICFVTFCVGSVALLYINIGFLFTRLSVSFPLV